MSRRGTVRIVCARCRRSRMHEARGICASCYNVVRRSETEELTDYERITWDEQSLVGEAEFLAGQHPEWTRKKLAERLGITYRALWVAESRTRKRAAA